jgi:hypothetical protein
MQLNRLKFEGGNATKQLDPLFLENVIYMDRYEYKNREISEKIRRNVQSIRDKIKLLEKTLLDYTSFNGSEYNIQKILALASSFFKEQGNPKEEFKQVPGLNLFSPVD